MLLRAREKEIVEGEFRKGQLQKQGQVRLLKGNGEVYEGMI